MHCILENVSFLLQHPKSDVYSTVYAKTLGQLYQLANGYMNQQLKMVISTDGLPCTLDSWTFGTTLDVIALSETPSAEQKCAISVPREAAPCS